MSESDNKHINFIMQAYKDTHNLDFIRYSISLKLIDPKQICTIAAGYGLLKLLKWACKQNYPWDVVTSWTAAVHRHANILLWACKNGCPINETVVILATQQGYLRVLCCIYNAGYTLGSQLYLVALENNHFDIIEWLYKKGICFDENFLLLAWQLNRIDIMHWAIKRGAPMKQLVQYLNRPYAPICLSKN